jgi:hypothetical protein
MVKTSNKQILDGLEELNIGKIKSLLSKANILNENEDELKCKYCFSFNAKNRASLSAHIRGCKFYLFKQNDKPYIDKTQEEPEEENIELIISEKEPTKIEPTISEKEPTTKEETKEKKKMNRVKK